MITKREWTHHIQRQGKAPGAGFTLLELIVVIVILGIISVVVMAKYSDMRKEAAVAHADAVFKAAQTACARHFAKKLMGAVSDNITSCTDLVGYMAEDPTDGPWRCSGQELRAELGGSTYTIRIESSETSTKRAGLCCTWGSINCPSCN